MDDFCRMTPGEFAGWIKAWAALDEGRERGAWERARLVAAVSLFPHLRKGASRDPKKIIPLAWDPAADKIESAPRREITREEADKLFEKRMRERARTNA